MPKPITPDLFAEWQTYVKQAADLKIHEPALDLHAIDVAETLLSIARTMAGIACQRCAGLGMYAYSDTSTWGRGGGGQAITTDTCDLCWGTGRSDRTGANLREIQAQLRAAKGTR